MHDPWTWTKGEDCWKEGGNRVEGGKGGKIGTTVIIINKIYFKKKKWRPELKVWGRTWIQACLIPKIKCYFSIQHTAWRNEQLNSVAPALCTLIREVLPASSFTLRRKGKGHLLINPVDSQKQFHLKEETSKYMLSPSWSGYFH